MIKPWWVSLQFATSLFAKLSEHVLDMRRLWHHETEPAEGTGLIVVIGEPGTIRRRWARMGIREEQRKDMVSCSTKSRGDSVTGFWICCAPWEDLRTVLGWIMKWRGTQQQSPFPPFPTDSWKLEASSSKISQGKDLDSGLDITELFNECQQPLSSDYAACA